MRASRRQRGSTMGSDNMKQKIIDRLEAISRGPLTAERRFRLCTLEGLHGRDDQVSRATLGIKANQSVTLLGACGSGKTHLAVGLLRVWLRDVAPELLPSQEALDRSWATAAETWIENNEWLYPKFVSASEFFLELKQSFKTDQGESPILNKYSLTRACPLLVFDDLGAEKVSDWSRQMLFTLIDRRYRDCAQTIITSNLSLQELSEQYDDRIPSRLLEMGPVIDLGKVDYRAKMVKVK